MFFVRRLLIFGDHAKPLTEWVVPIGILLKLRATPEIEPITSQQTNLPWKEPLKIKTWACKNTFKNCIYENFGLKKKVRRY